MRTVSGAVGGGSAHFFFMLRVVALEAEDPYALEVLFVLVTPACVCSVS